MFHPGIFGFTSSHEDHLSQTNEDEDPTVDHSVLLCCSAGDILTQHESFRQGKYCYD